MLALLFETRAMRCGYEWRPESHRVPRNDLASAKHGRIGPHSCQRIRQSAPTSSKLFMDAVGVSKDTGVQQFRRWLDRTERCSRRRAPPLRELG